MYEEKFGTTAGANRFGSREPCVDFYRKPGRTALVEESYWMNCREEIREHLLVERMKRWLSRARYSTQCPKWQARRNYRFLVRSTVR
jgi:hypothetical protein